MDVGVELAEDYSLERRGCCQLGVREAWGALYKRQRFDTLKCSALSESVLNDRPPQAEPTKLHPH